MGKTTEMDRSQEDYQCGVYQELGERQTKSDDCYFGRSFCGQDLQGFDLSAVYFLIQAQLNLARGDRHTRIPGHLKYPRTWGKAHNC